MGKRRWEREGRLSKLSVMLSFNLYWFMSRILAVF
jgi:hypothetical protein